MTTLQLKILTQLEDLSTSMIEGLEKSLPAANKQIAESLREFVFSLEKTSVGKIKATVANLKKIDVYRKVLGKVITDKAYAASVGEFLSQFSEASRVIDLYFATVSTSFNPGKVVYEAITQAAIQTTTDGLLASGIDANLKDAIIKTLRQNVAGGSDSKALGQLLENEILGTETTSPLLNRYVKQVASDSVHQYSANYLQAVGDSLNLEYAYYQGTKIADSRPFCIERAGKYFSIVEIKSWASLNWAGKIKGTNSENIMTNRGGYGCRHLIIPVSKELYELKTKGK